MKNYNDKMSHKLKSPFFIVGLPRSGTKLLRDLLRQNPLINIPISGKSFHSTFKYLLKNYGFACSKKD